MQQVDAEMTKALALGAVNPEQKEYYNVLKNFKQNLNPVGGKDGSTDGRRAMFMLDDANRPVDPNSPSEIEKRTVATRDKKRFEDWSKAGGIGLGPTKDNLGDLKDGTYGNLQMSRNPFLVASQNDMVDPTLAATRAFLDYKADGEGVGRPSTNRGRNEKRGIRDLLAPDPIEGNKNVRVAVRDYASYNPFSPITYDNAMERAGEPIRRSNQNINQPPAAAQQSFTQQEAAFSNNTSALTTLAGGIESLNSTLSNFEANFGNLNNVPGAQPVGAQTQAGAQPGATTTTNAPVSVIVNAQGSNDIAVAVGEAIKNEIPNIVDRVRVALGPPFNKVTPKATKP
jgi:hypothetical protein